MYADISINIYTVAFRGTYTLNNNDFSDVKQETYVNSAFNELNMAIQKHQNFASDFTIIQSSIKDG